MKKLTLSYIVIFFLIVSCSAEKINLSPVAGLSSGSKVNQSTYSLKERKNLIVYASEITNLMASFPKFSSEAVNKELVQLNYHLKDYIGAIEAYNMNGLAIAERNFERSYKKLQKLRKFLNQDEDEVLNRYLVRIKTNLSILNNNIPKDSLSPILKN